MELDNGRVPDDSARPKFAAAPGSFVREGTKNDAIGGRAINVHLLAGSKRKVAEMYADTGSAGALDDYDNYLRAIWIDEFLRSRLGRDGDTSVDADLVRRLHRNGTNVQRVQSYASCLRIYLPSVSDAG